jgi:hypothetical protein
MSTYVSEEDVSIWSFQEKSKLETSKRQLGGQFVFFFDPESGGGDFLQNVC